MKSSYKPLGDYIRTVDERNSALEDLPLMGLSVSKVFFPSIANLVGTDMKTYKIVYKKQFTYIADTSRRGDKIAIALNQEFDKMLVSQAYTPFEVRDSNELDPEYLMMWFRRPEFDRYARFKSHGSAREIFDWDEMCNTLLPIPSITKQKEIVKEYNVFQNRIALNQQLIQKLEETAQAIYREWFVEFEFPDENGKPYKSNGGEMVWNEELGKEIPLGWEVKDLGKVIVYKKGYAFKSDDYLDNGKAIIRVSDLGQKYVECSQFYKTKQNQEFDNYKVSYLDLIITTVGSWPSNPLSVVGKLVRVPSFADGYYLNQNMVRIRPIQEIREVVYQQLIQKSFSDYLVSGAQGSANQASITLEHTFQFKVLVPKDMKLNLLFERIYDFIDSKIIENQKLTELKDLLLSKLANI
jgi:type I restriction enzyme, S subunit